jgi:tetratricopeptide (TPR) repeat protein
MIDLPVTEKTDDTGFVPRIQHFQVDLPTGTSLIAATSLALSQHGEVVEVTPVEHDSCDAGTGNADTILKTIFSESRHQVERYPESSRAHVNLGLAFLNCGELDQADKEFEQALHIDPTQYLPKASLARVRILQGRLEEAEEIFLRLKQAHPDDPRPLMNLADVAARRGQFEESVHLWKEVIQHESKDASAQFFLGMAFLATHRPHEAIKHLRAAVHLEVRSPVMHYGLGIAYLFSGNYQKAVLAFRAALILAPSMSSAIHGLAMTLLNQGHADEVIDLLSKYLKKEADDYQAKEIIALAYMQQKHYKKVRTHLFAALQLVPKTGDEVDLHRARLANNLGVCYGLLNDTGDAMRLFQHSIQAKPDLEPGVYHNLIRLQITICHFDEARQTINACITQFPNDEEAQLLLGSLLDAELYGNEAITIVQRLVQAGGASKEAYKQLAILMMEWKQDFTDVLAVLNEAQQRFPHDVGIMNMIAYAHLMQGNPGSARAVLDAVPKKVPPREEILLSATWGLVHLWEGNYEKGKQGYLQAEQIARQQGRDNLIPVIQQKMHLELARAYKRAKDLRTAQREVRVGLSKTGIASYRRDLERLAEDFQLSIT